MAARATDGALRARSLLGCLVYTAGGLLLLLGGLAAGDSAQQIRLLRAGETEREFTDYDESGSVIGRHFEAVSASEAERQRRAGLASVAGGAIAVAAGFALRGAPWRRLVPAASEDEEDRGL